MLQPQFLRYQMNCRPLRSTQRSCERQLIPQRVIFEDKAAGEDFESS